ncbi:hypothetical protein [Vibrio mediterranei]|uniref:Uncharacterized protein n=1 Tax=Vibrio mediterranei TaxID=689 RepID=A0A3G4V4Y8_9VIBR|nr:hypothetical protein [Vibrio mediterranei]AYV19828.1 hypothetical protein ECB94_00325 [Vibrio mediterranei]AYV19836.1 hypothetical protein ECB94_00365 [Vibrio mediterranei]
MEFYQHQDIVWSSKRLLKQSETLEVKPWDIYWGNPLSKLARQASKLGEFLYEEDTEILCLKYKYSYEDVWSARANLCEANRIIYDVRYHQVMTYFKPMIAISFTGFLYALFL